jgi:hypothetical protein
MSGIEVNFDNISVTNIITSVDDKMISDYYENNVKIFPNPVHQEMNLIYTVPARDLVKIEIYNIMGQKILTLVNEEKAAGEYSFTYNFTDNRYNSSMPDGVYLCHISVSGQLNIQKFIIVGN